MRAARPSNHNHADALTMSFTRVPIPYKRHAGGSPAAILLIKDILGGYLARREYCRYKRRYSGMGHRNASSAQNNLLSALSIGA